MRNEIFLYKYLHIIISPLCINDLINNPIIIVDTNNVNPLLTIDIILKDTATEKDRDIFNNFQIKKKKVFSLRK